MSHVTCHIQPGVNCKCVPNVYDWPGTTAPEELQREIEFGPSFHGLPFAASTLLSGRTLIVTNIFSIIFFCQYPWTSVINSFLQKEAEVLNSLLHALAPLLYHSPILCTVCSPHCYILHSKHDCFQCLNNPSPVQILTLVRAYR